MICVGGWSFAFGVALGFVGIVVSACWVLLACLYKVVGLLPLGYWCLVDSCLFWGVFGDLLFVLVAWFELFCFCCGGFAGLGLQIAWIWLAACG